MLATLFVALVVVGFWLLFRFRNVIFILFVGILIGTAVKPAAAWFARRGIPRVPAQILVYVLLLLVIVGFLVVALPMILDQSTAITDQLDDYYTSARMFMVRSPSAILTRLGFRLPSQFEVEDLVQANGGAPQAQAEPGTAQAEDEEMTELVAQVFYYTGLAAGTIFTIIAILLTSFYWTLEGDRAIRSVLLLVPKPQRENVREVIQAIEDRLGGYLLGQATLMLVIGGLQLVAYLLIGLPNALLLAIIAGVMEAVPVVGPVLGALPAVLVAATTSPDKIIWVLVSAGLIQFFENNWLVPRVMDKSVGVNPLLTLLALAAFSSLMGLPGAVLAIPLAAILQLVFNRFIFDPSEDAPIEPAGRDHLSYLRYQVQEIAQDIRKQVRMEDGDEEPETDQVKDSIEAIANDLDRLLGQAAPKDLAATKEGGQA
jgi:predicted PurR-regulated permease PerM